MSKIRVILIEDHDLTRLGIRAALSQNKELEVICECANATEGLKMLKQLRPDIAIVDIGLPDMDGIELTSEIKAVVKTGELNTKVLILTMEDASDSVLAAFAAGADSYCMKDIHFDNLLEAVRVTYNGHAWIDPAIAKVVLHQAKQNQKPKKSLSSNKNHDILLDIDENEQQLEDYALTERELEVLQLVVEGCSNLVIAERLFITIGTVKTHVRNILNKLSAADRTQAAVRALRSGIVR